MILRSFNRERLAGFLRELAPAGKHSRAAYWLAVAIIVFHYHGMITVNSLRPEYSHFDEPNWMWVSVETWRHVQARDWRDEFWVQEYANWGSPSPQLGKFFIGAPLDWYLRMNPDIPLHEFGNFGDTKNSKVWPNERLYYPARLQAAIFVMLTAFLIVDLAATLFGSWTALFGCLWFLGHPYIHVVSFRAMTDACALFGSTLAFYGVFRKRGWAMVLVTSLGLGWALATKVNGILIFPAVAAALFLRLRSEKRRVAYLVILAILCLGIFYGTNPYLWREPIAGVKHMLSNYPTAGQNISFLQAVTGLFWDSCSTGGVAGSSIFVRSLRLAMVLYALSILAPTRNTRRRMFCWGALVLWTCLILTTPKPWERYFIYGLPMISILAGYASAIACRLVWPWVRSVVGRGRGFEAGEPVART